MIRRKVNNNTKDTKYFFWYDYLVKNKDWKQLFFFIKLNYEFFCNEKKLEVIVCACVVKETDFFFSFSNHNRKSTT